MVSCDQDSLMLSPTCYSSSICRDDFYADLDTSQRYVKRKYDTLLVDQLPTNRKNDARGPASGKACLEHVDTYSNKEKVPGSSHMDPLPMFASKYCDSLMVCTMDGCGQGIDSGNNKLGCNLGLYEPYLSQVTEQMLRSVTEVEGLVDEDLQPLNKEKGCSLFHGTISMGADDSLRCISLGKPEQLDHHSKNHLDHCSACEDELILLRAALRTEHEAVNALCIQLEEERNASAVAATEAVNMIARLHEEKAAMQMESHHYEMIVGERVAHDEEVIVLLKEILMKREEQILVLENELDAYREMLRSFELEGWEKEACRRILFEFCGKEGGLHLLESKEESLHLSDDTQTSFCWETAEDVCSRVFSNIENTDRTLSGHSIYESVTRNSPNKFDAVYACEGKHQPADAPGRLSTGNSRFNRVSQDEMPSSRDLSKDIANNQIKSTFCIAEDSENWREKKSEENEQAEEARAIVHVQPCTELYTGGNTVNGTKASPDEEKLSVEAILPAFVAEECGDQCVWERLRRLEERLEHVGEQQQYQKVWLNKSTHVLRDEWAVDGKAVITDFEDVTSRDWNVLKENKNAGNQSSDTNSATTLECSYPADMEESSINSHPLERLVRSQSSGTYSVTTVECSYTGDMEDSSENGPCLEMLLTSSPYKQHTESESTHKHWCKARNKSCQQTWRDLTKQAATQDIDLGESFDPEEQDVESEESCIQRCRPVGDREHDIFEVRETFKRSRRSLSEESVKNDGLVAACESPGILHLSEESILREGKGIYSLDDCGAKARFTAPMQSAVVYDTEILDESVLQSTAHKGHPIGASLEVTADHITMFGKEAEQLTLRLHALEAEKVFMKKAIESLEQENEKLKLKDIAAQLRQQKRNAEISNQPKEPLQREQLSFLSLFKACVFVPKKHKFRHNARRPFRGKVSRFKDGCLCIRRAEG